MKEEELFEAIQTVCAWEQDYRTRNNLGPKPPDCFIWLATLAAQHLKREQEPAPRYWNYDALPCAKCEGIHDGPCVIEGVGDDELANELLKAKARCVVLEAEIGRLTRGKPDCV